MNIIIETKDLRSYGHSVDVDMHITSARNELVERIKSANNEYIDDIISDIADGETPVYNKELFLACADLYEPYEEGKENGIVDTSSSLPAQLMQAYYLLIETSLYDALKDCIFNAYAETFNAGTHQHFTEAQKAKALFACEKYAREQITLDRYGGLAENVREDRDRILTED